MRRLFASLAIAALPAVAAPPGDVVVIGGALTEVVYALGAEGRIAATDTTSIHPAAAEATPKVGYQRALSAEGVLALRPRLMLASAEAGPPAALAQIRGAGVKIVDFPAEPSFDAVRSRVREIARALEREPQGRELESRLVAEWAQVRARVDALKTHPRILFVLAHVGPSMQVAGEGTAADAMIRFAGGVNAMSGFTGYRPLTAEGVVNARPDVILVTDQGFEAQGGIEGLIAKPGIALTPAGRGRKIVKMEALYLLGFGPRMPRAVLDLAQAIHP